MSPKTSKKEKDPPFYVRLPANLDKRLRDTSKRTGISRPAIVRLSLDAYMKRIRAKTKLPKGWEASPGTKRRTPEEPLVPYLHLQPRPFVEAVAAFCEEYDMTRAYAVTSALNAGLESLEAQLDPKNITLDI